MHERPSPGGDPSSGAAIPVKRTTYNLYNQPRVVTERTPSGTTLRTTTTTYDASRTQDSGIEFQGIARFIECTLEKRSNH